MNNIKFIKITTDEEAKELMPLVDASFNTIVTEGVEGMDEIEDATDSEEMMFGMMLGENRDTFRIMDENQLAGFAIIKCSADKTENELELFGIAPTEHSRGMGTKIWFMIEEMYPETITWKTGTPAFLTKNIHFYINKCGFHIVEFFNPAHRPGEDRKGEFEDLMCDAGYYIFKKEMKKA